MVFNQLTRSIVYGGVDGIITMSNIISGINGANINVNYIIILGLSTLIADAISMGTSDFLSTKANNKINNLKENPNKHGLTTFISFIIFGMIPIFTFFLLYYLTSLTKKNIFILSYISTFISLFVLGVYQSKLTGELWYKNASIVSIYGTTASIVAFYLGKIFNKMINSNKIVKL